ncbi:MAG: UDP-N-acetylmuramoyl-tripeptide--D-alanyl-D-alanine ligase, partial [Spirochaetes bacterium]
NLGADGFLLVRNGIEVIFRIPGEHNLLNAMAAVEAASVLGAPESSIVKGLEAIKPLPGRSEVINGAVKVIQDSYNANPESLNAALKLFSSVKTTGRRVLVLGELLELGNETNDLLRLAGRAAAEENPDSIFLFGKSLGNLKDAAVDAGYKGLMKQYVDIKELQNALSEYLRAGDLVLLKGSRGSALERLNKTIGEVSSG